MTPWKMYILFPFRNASSEQKQSSRRSGSELHHSRGVLCGHKLTKEKVPLSLCTFQSCAISANGEWGDPFVALLKRTDCLFACNPPYTPTHTYGELLHGRLRATLGAALSLSETLPRGRFQCVTRAECIQMGRR